MKFLISGVLLFLISSVLFYNWKKEKDNAHIMELHKVMSESVNVIKNIEDKQKEIDELQKKINKLKNSY